MILKAILPFSVLAIFASCKGQNQIANSDVDSQTSFGTNDTLTNLGNKLLHVFQDKNNNYWFGSDGEGLYRFDGKNLEHFTTKDGLYDNRIGKIQEDKMGNIYFNSPSGITKFDGQRFTKLMVKKDSDNSWNLEPDDLWFEGPQDAGVVYRYDGESLYRLTFPRTKHGDVYNSKFPNVPYSPYDVYSIYKDSKGHVWFGTSCLGVCRYDGGTFTWISEKELEFDIETAFGVRSIIEDNDNKFWFSNTLHRFTILENGSYIKEKGIDSVENRNNLDIVPIISMAKVNDDLWMATYNKGVLKYSDNQITHFPVKNNGKDITLFTIYKDNNDDLWLGTHENGAYKYNGKTFEKFRP